MKPLRILVVCFAFFVASVLGVTSAAGQKSTTGNGLAPKWMEDVSKTGAANKHEGIWNPIAAVLGGARQPPAALQAITLTINGENYELRVAGEKESDRGTCTLDTNTVPKRMTIKSTEGPNAGKTFLAIYEMKDAVSMRVCYDLSGTAFPREFKAPKGTQLYLVGYRRQKQELQRQ